MNALSPSNSAVTLRANKRGQLITSRQTDNPVFSIVVPPLAVGANKVHLDIFNATGSGKSLRLRGLKSFAGTDVAVTGVVGVRLSLTRTSAVGTGGTAVASEGTDQTVPTIAKLDPAYAALPAEVTARSAPAGGATAGAVLGLRLQFTEETSVVSAPYEFTSQESSVLVPEGTGLRIVQGSVAGVGTVGYEILLELV